MWFEIRPYRQLIMRFLTAVATVVLALSTVAWAGQTCEYTAAVNACQPLVDGGALGCEYWTCIHKKCPTTFTLKTARKRCQTPQKKVAEPSEPVAVDGDNNKVGFNRGKHNPSLMAARAVDFRTAMLNATHNSASPCGHKADTRAEQQHYLHQVSMDVYADRAHEHYTEGSQRWSGIAGHVCPANAPRYSDCSSTVTWIYWTLFGNGPDFMNNENWSAGYTGTLIQNGFQVSTSALEVGDLCFYYHPMHHVAIYVGGGKIVSHGMDPVGYYPVNYAPLDYCRRYL